MQYPVENLSFTLTLLVFKVNVNTSHKRMKWRDIIFIPYRNAISIVITAHRLPWADEH